jgi:hypothetical protein
VEPNTNPAEPLRAILVDPFLKQIVVMENLTPEGLDAAIKQHIGDDLSWNSLAPPGDYPGVQFVLDDWAVMKNGQRYFRIRDYEHPLGGRVIFVGYDKEGFTVALPEVMTAWFEDRVSFCPETMKFVRFEEREDEVPSPYSVSGKAKRITRIVVYEGTDDPTVDRT